MVMDCIRRSYTWVRGSGLYDGIDYPTNVAITGRRIWTKSCLQAAESRSGQLPAKASLLEAKALNRRIMSANTADMVRPASMSNYIFYIYFNISH
jgi:hypothetical protein